jgi:hypothetical protein
MGASPGLESSGHKKFDLEQMSQFCLSSEKKSQRSQLWVKDLNIPDFLDDTDSLEGNFAVWEGKKIFIGDEILKIESFGKINPELNTKKPAIGGTTLVPPSKTENYRLNFFNEDFKWKVVGGDLNHSKLWVYSSKQDLLALVNLKNLAADSYSCYKEGRVFYWKEFFVENLQFPCAKPKKLSDSNNQAYAIGKFLPPVTSDARP